MNVGHVCLGFSTNPELKQPCNELLLFHLPSDNCREESTNIILNFSMLFYAIDTYLYTLRRLLSAPSKCVL